MITDNQKPKQKQKSAAEKAFVKINNAAKKTIKRFDPTIDDFKSEHPRPIMELVVNDGDYVRVSEFGEDYNFQTYSPIVVEYINESFTGDMKEDPDGMYFKYADVQHLVKDLILLRIIEKYSASGSKLTKEFINDVLRLAKRKDARELFDTLPLYDGEYSFVDISTLLTR